MQHSLKHSINCKKLKLSCYFAMLYCLLLKLTRIISCPFGSTQVDPRKTLVTSLYNSITQTKTISTGTLAYWENGWGMSVSPKISKQALCTVWSNRSRVSQRTSESTLEGISWSSWSESPIFFVPNWHRVGDVGPSSLRLHPTCGARWAALGALGAPNACGAHWAEEVGQVGLHGRLKL